MSETEAYLREQIEEFGRTVARASNYKEEEPEIKVIRRESDKLTGAIIEYVDAQVRHAISRLEGV